MALTTFKTPFERFCWLRLAFGLSSSQKIFKQPIAGMAGVACIADDVLLFGCGDTAAETEADHDQNLIALLERCRERNSIKDEKLYLRHSTTIFFGPRTNGK